MNLNTPYLFLAENFGKMLIQLFILAVVIISMISKVKKKNDQPQPHVPRNDPSPPDEPVTIEELAARRRRRMKELARRQQQSERAVQPQPRAATEPSNLTMAQRVQRARAKAMYEERARQLKQQPEIQLRKTDTPAAQTSPSPSPQRTRLTSATTPRTEQPQPSRVSKKTLRGQSMPTAVVEAEHEQNVVHRHVPDAPKPVTIARHFQLGRVTHRTLRNAVMLKEILDLPVALREPGATPLHPRPRPVKRS